MNLELREAIGKVLLKEIYGLWDWENEPKEVREQCMRGAEKVVEAYKQATPLKVSTVRIKSMVEQEEGKSE